MSHPISVQHEIVTGAPGIDTVKAKAYFSPLGMAWRLVQPTFGATITIDLSQGSMFEIIATASTNITIAAPTNVSQAISAQIIILVSNQSGGAMGTITLNAAYKVPSTAPFSTPPANGKNQASSWANLGTQAAPLWYLMWNQSSDSGN